MKRGFTSGFLVGLLTMSALFVAHETLAGAEQPLRTAAQQANAARVTVALAQPTASMMR